MALRLQKTELGGLTVRLVEAKEAKPELHLVLCHGYGAGGDDLVGLGAELLMGHPELASRVRCVFPEAPLSLDALGAPGGRAWWHLDMTKLMSRRPEDLEQRLREEPEGLPEARALLDGMLKQLAAGTGIPVEKTVLGGFSQGSMLATDVALRAEVAPAGLAVLSGAPLCVDVWKERAATRREMPVFQSHGRQDAILPFAWGEAMRGILEEGGLTVTSLPFQGPHGIPGEVAGALSTWLAVRLGAGK